MELKTLTWNIGGGKLLQDGADPLRIASCAENSLDAIAIYRDIGDRGGQAGALTDLGSREHDDGDCRRTAGDAVIMPLLTAVHLRQGSSGL
jgi:hypothetical protein